MGFGEGIVPWQGGEEMWLPLDLWSAQGQAGQGWEHPGTVEGGAG